MILNQLTPQSTILGRSPSENGLSRRRFLQVGSGRRRGPHTKPELAIRRRRR